MDQKIISGKELSQIMNSSIKEEIKSLLNNNKRLPKLIVLQVGQNDASKIYVRNKLRACEKVGMLCEHINLEETISESELLNKIDEFNIDSSVDGIIVQLPLPKHIDDNKVIDKISVDKDADGFSPNVLGNLMINKTDIYPATPMGIVKLLKWKDVNLVGKEVVIIGRSNIVGKPLANMLINESCTVTICNTKTPDVKFHTKRADIVIAAAGVAKLVNADYIKDGAIIIDVGANRVNGEYCGDVDFEDVINKVSLITPVPGGVGPMTIACLIKNVFTLYKMHI